MVDLNGDLVIFLNLEFDSMVKNLNNATFYLLYYIIFMKENAVVDVNRDLVIFSSKNQTNILFSFFLRTEFDSYIFHFSSQPQIWLRFFFKP